MSDRTLVELNHDYAPKYGVELSDWAKALRSYLSSGDKKELPSGVTFVQMRHHTEPDLQQQLEAANQRIKGLKQNIDNLHRHMDKQNSDYLYLYADKEAAERKLATAQEALIEGRYGGRNQYDEACCPVCRRGLGHNGECSYGKALAQIEQPPYRGAKLRSNGWHDTHCECGECAQIEQPQPRQDDSLQYPPEKQGRTFTGKIVERTISKPARIEDEQQPQSTPDEREQLAWVIYCAMEKLDPEYPSCMSPSGSPIPWDNVCDPNKEYISSLADMIIAAGWQLPGEDPAVTP